MLKFSDSNSSMTIAKPQFYVFKNNQAKNSGCYFSTCLQRQFNENELM